MEDIIVPFVRKSVQINLTFLKFFESRLQLPEGALLKLHDERDLNGGEARCIRTPPRQTSTGVGAHTDFGSLVWNALYRSAIVILNPRRGAGNNPQSSRWPAGDASEHGKMAIYQGALSIHCLLAPAY